MTVARGETLRAQPTLAHLDDAAIDRLAQHATEVRFAVGELVLEEGGDATVFYLVTSGRVSLEIHASGRGRLLVETIGPGGIVGWSWLFPPYRWHFDARALEPVTALAFDGAAVRESAGSDPAFGYALLLGFSGVMLDRLQSTRVRLLDLYGHDDAR